MSIAPARRSPPEPSGVRSREDFAEFLRLLRDDLRTRPERWENVTLGSFLEAFAAISESCPGWISNGVRDEVEAPSWQLFADLIDAAAIYE